ncbi:signal transduction histidine kinase [Paenibacillus castaneae]|uniref:ATP-binding protein n=1 Tax=Paenibacillus castaneae TaxID=474957 RepID=UPI000C99DFE5|nr:ATP-binding protein [Paenibacillus castaneae]NIK76761.1 signal transduction histidine kinase [Paenibacillus castaneae]
MGKLRLFYNGRITRRFVSMMILALTLILIGAVFMLWSTISILTQYKNETDEIRHKQELVSQIADHSNEIILRARGYYVYLNDYEYNQIFVEKKGLKDSLIEIKKLSLTEDEQEVMQNIESFFTDYFDDILPEAIALAQKQDYESLRTLVKAGENNPVNALIKYSREFKDKVQHFAEQKNDKLIQKLSMQAIFFILYTLIILFLSSFITRRIATDIGAPLKQLTVQARRFADGELFQLENLTRLDEIGELSRSLQKMMGKIQNKEEELLSQNEELQAQQDELQAQQEELQEALGQMEKNEQYLMKRNLLIQSLTNTLDQNELLQSIVSNMVSITESDKGLIVMMNDQHDYAAIGVSNDAAKQFILTINEGIVVRASQTKKSYTIVRDCHPAEQGYHSQPMRATDLILPILNSENEMAACLILTKVNKAVAKQEEAEIVGMMTQVSLAFDKLKLYEQSEKQRQMTGDMLNTIQEGIQFMDLKGTTLQINRKMSEIFGFFQSDIEKIELELDSFLALIEATVVEPEPLIKFIRNLANNDVLNHLLSMNYEIKEPDRRFIQIYCEPLYRNGEKFGLLLVHRDITKEYEVDRMKSEFVSTVSHELRTPLASVLGFAELLLHRELKPERQRKYVTTIHQEARRLTTLINDFLDLQRMESGKQTYDMHPLSLTTLINEVIETQQMTAPSHRITWHNQASQMLVVADREKMQQSFINLISNAIKYSPNGGEIKVSSSIHNNQIMIRIEDEGLGIPKEAIPNLFNKFYRVDNSDRREIGGTGLGLAIVHEIITRHKGSIEVESEFGHGSTFIVSLPIDESMNRSLLEEQQIMIKSETSINVMLIENDHNLSILLRDELQSKGFNVQLYTEGKKAIEEIELLNPDIVVIDLMLEAEISGWDIISKIKKSASLINIPIIISSAFEEKEKAAQWGIHEFLVKPYLPGKLSEAIQRMVR